MRIAPGFSRVVKKTLLLLKARLKRAYKIELMFTTI